MTLDIIGGTAVDVIFRKVPRLPGWPAHTEFTPANLVLLREPPLVTLGGNGGNAAYAAARCGADVTLHTALARDAFGDLAFGWLSGAGCQVRRLKPAPATAVNATAANARMQRATFYYPGAVPPMPKLARSRRQRVVLVCGWPHPPLAAVADEFRALRRRGALTALDCGPFLSRAWKLTELQPVLASLGILLANDYELCRMARTGDVALALARLRRGFAGDVVIKRGADGALWLPAGSSEPQPVPAPRVRVVNTIGAGDAFNGTLLAALSCGAAMPAALEAATGTAATVVASPQGVLGVVAGGSSSSRKRSADP